MPLWGACHRCGAPPRSHPVAIWIYFWERRNCDSMTKYRHKVLGDLLLVVWGEQHLFWHQLWKKHNKQKTKYGKHNKPTKQIWQTQQINKPNMAQYLERMQHLKLVVDEWDPVLRHLFCKFKSNFSKNLFLKAFNSQKKTWPARPLPPCGLLAQKQNQYCSGCSRGDERTPSWIKIWFDRNVP